MDDAAMLPDDPDSIAIEIAYLRERLADVRQRAASAKSHPARIAYEELGRLYEAQIVMIETTDATRSSDPNYAAKGD